MVMVSVLVEADDDDPQPENDSVVTTKNFLRLGLSVLFGGGRTQSSPVPIDTQRLQGRDASQAR